MAEKFKFPLNITVQHRVSEGRPFSGGMFIVGRYVYEDVSGRGVLYRCRMPDGRLVDFAEAELCADERLKAKRDEPQQALSPTPTTDDASKDGEKV